MPLFALRDQPLCHDGRRLCDARDCCQEGCHPAPDRYMSLSLRFCLEHVRLYNRAWSCYAHMSQEEIERDQAFDRLGRRETCSVTGGGMEEELRACASAWLNQGTDSRPPAPANGVEPVVREALSVLGLPPGSGRESIRRRYRALVKRLHPDVSGDNSARNLGRMREITRAWQILRDRL